jgi:uncharacterized membrane protein
MVYDLLPDPLPTHFDMHGRPNGWMPRAVGAWFVPALALATWAFVRFVARLWPAQVHEQKRGPDRATAIVAALTTTFLAVVHLIVVYVAVVPGASVIRPLWVGLVTPRLRRNRFIGVRTPWTLTSDENWARTHRVAGYTMVAGGIVVLVAGLIGGAAAGALVLAVLLVSGLVPMIHSFILSRAERRRS